jgi:protein-disulfide isomerase
MEHTEHKEQRSGGGDNFLPMSILVAAVLISGSILYAVNRTPGGPTPVPSAPGTDAPAPTAANNSALLAIGDRDAVIGSDSAPVTLIEYTDYQCPFCRRHFEQTEPQLVEEYVRTNKVRYVVRQFPLGFHQNAAKASEAALCAGAQGAYWKMHETLFKNGQGDGTGLALADLKRYAAELKLDTAKFNTCLDGGQMADKVANDLKNGQALGVNGTPGFFVNGTPITGAQPFSAFKAAIDAALNS